MLPSPFTLHTLGCIGYNRCAAYSSILKLYYGRSHSDSPLLARRIGAVLIFPFRLESRSDNIVETAHVGFALFSCLDYSLAWYSFYSYLYFFPFFNFFFQHIWFPCGDVKKLEKKTQNWKQTTTKKQRRPAVRLRPLSTADLCAGHQPLRNNQRERQRWRSGRFRRKRQVLKSIANFSLKRRFYFFLIKIFNYFPFIFPNHLPSKLKYILRSDTTRSVYLIAPN